MMVLEEGMVEETLGNRYSGRRGRGGKWKKKEAVNGVGLEKFCGG